MEENNESKNKSKNERLKNAICYIPFAAFIIFFSEPNKSKDLIKHIKYWIALFFIYIFLQMFLWWAFRSFLFIWYLWIIWFLWHKAYNWEKIELEYIDKMEGKLRDTLNNTK